MNKLASRWLMAVVVAWFILACVFWFVTDDAYISFRYAKNWAQGLGLRFNPGDHVPVEGYSNFLWVLLGAGFEKIGIPSPVVLPGLSLLCGAGLVYTTWQVARDRFQLEGWALTGAVSAVALSPAVVIWSTGGLATLPAAWMLLVMVDRWVLSDTPRDVWVGAAAALALSLLRTEGVGWVVVAAGFGAGLKLWAEPNRKGLKGLLAAVLATLVLFALYYLGRYAYFQSWVSNTALAKVAMGPEKLWRGTQYVLGYWAAALVPPLYLACTPGGLRQGAKGAVVAAFAWGPVAYAILIGGDFMTMGRVLVPSVAFSGVLFGLGLQGLSPGWARGLAVALPLLGTLPLANVHPVPEDVRRLFRVRFNSTAFRTEVEQHRFMRSNAIRWGKMGKALAQVEQPGESLVLGAIGAVGYHSGVFIYDRYGLVSREVALRESNERLKKSPGHDKHVPIGFFLKDEPTYLRLKYLPGTAGLTKAKRELASWGVSGEMRQDYGPRIEPVRVDGESGYVLLVTRSDDAKALWDGFDARLVALRAGKNDSPFAAGEGAGAKAPAAQDEAAGSSEKKPAKKRRKRKRAKTATQGEADPAPTPPGDPTP